MDEEFYNHLSIYSKMQNSRSTLHLFMFGQENGNILKRVQTCMKMHYIMQKHSLHSCNELENKRLV